MKIEAEGSEIIMQNSNGDTIVIPKVHRQKALKYIEEGNYKAIDELAESLPFMEDYADDGSVIVPKLNEGTTEPSIISPAEKKTTKSSVKMYTSEDYNKLKLDYQKGNFVKYDVEAGVGCTSVACQNNRKLYPDYSSTYADIEEARKKGKIPGEIRTSSKKVYDPNKPRHGDGSAMDAWEIHQFYRYNNLGKKMFEAKFDDPNREKSISEFDYKTLPSGTLLGHGTARGEYIDPDAKDYTGKDAVELPRHLSIVQGYVEGVDSYGNKTADLLIDDLGKLHRVGDSKDADMSWSDYSGKITEITSRNNFDKTDYYSLSGVSNSNLPDGETNPLIKLGKDLTNPKKVRELKEKIQLQKDIQDAGNLRSKKAVNLLKNPFQSLEATE
jgi:hypothetical protein